MQLSCRGDATRQLWFRPIQAQAQVRFLPQIPLWEWDGRPNAEFVAVEGGHHFLSITNPDAVNSALRNFLTRHSQRLN
jgi:pimeloyl-ACP methyl ester carboxylesterase